MTPQERKVMELALAALEMYLLETNSQFQREAVTAIKEVLAAQQAVAEQHKQEPEFIKHEVENAEDWSEWVCPNPHKYLMKCCDCGLVHEAQFGVVRYKSEEEREACDFVDDPNMQAVFRMRRSEQWSPEDTAHRAGGLPMAQRKPLDIKTIKRIATYCDEHITDEDVIEITRRVEAAHGIKE